MKERDMETIQKDLVIVGGGPAGLAAALYGARNRYDTTVIEKYAPGGQINLTHLIENYPGIDAIGGADMSMALYQQAQKFEADIVMGVETKGLKKLDDGKIEVTTSGNTYIAKVVILAPGSSYRKLGVPGEEKHTGKGVCYCGPCDGPFFKDKEVVAVGGGNVAVEDAIFLSQYCKKVTLVHRRDEFRAEPILVEELLEKTKEGIIHIKYDSVVTGINGEDNVTSATIKNVKTDEEEDYPCNGVFVFVGTIPNTDFLKGVVDLDESGFIICNPADLSTSMPGVYVAGDCRTGAAMQLATAIGDGVGATIYMKQYLQQNASKW